MKKHRAGLDASRLAEFDQLDAYAREHVMRWARTAATHDMSCETDECGGEIFPRLVAEYSDPERHRGLIILTTVAMELLSEYVRAELEAT